MSVGDGWSQACENSALVNLGLTPTTNTADRAVDAALVRALSDAESAVVQSAATGAGRRRAASALPILVRLLGDQRPEVRMRSAQAIGQFGNSAKPFLPDLETALFRETNDVTRKTLDVIVQRLTK